MNYFVEDNPEIIAAIAALLGCQQSSIKHVKFAVSNPNNENPSIVTVDIYPVPMLQALFFIYTPDSRLHDVIAYRGERFVRVNRDGKAIQHIDSINCYLLEHCAKVSPDESIQIDEEDDEQDKLKQKDLQIQQLRDRNRVDKNTIQSLRNQMKILRAKKTQNK